MTSGGISKQRERGCFVMFGAASFPPSQDILSGELLCNPHNYFQITLFSLTQAVWGHSVYIEEGMDKLLMGSEARFLTSVWF